MKIIVPHSVRKRELGGEISEEARKIFDKIKDAPALAETISAAGLPARTTLHKVYATTANGPRRLLFFCRHVPPADSAKKATAAVTERWVLLLYRDKSDVVGRNMSRKNTDFVRALETNLASALEDIKQSTLEERRFETF